MLCYCCSNNITDINPKLHIQECVKCQPSELSELTPPSQEVEFKAELQKAIEHYMEFLKSIPVTVEDQRQPLERSEHLQ
jgi:hypothetical protein